MKKYSHEITIIIVIVFQAALYGFILFDDKIQFQKLIYPFIIFLSWIFYILSIKYRDHNSFLFPNEANVEATMEGMGIRTFNYSDYLKEYEEFTSTKTFTPVNTNNGLAKIPPLYYLLFDNKYQNDPKDRAWHASEIKTKEFCAALELYNLCRNKTTTHHSLFDFLNEEISEIDLNSYNHMINMALIFYRLHYENFLGGADFYFHFDFNEFVPRYFRVNSYNYDLEKQLKTILMSFIKKNFLTRGYPSYDSFLLYAQPFFDSNKEVTDNLNSLYNSAIKF